MATRLSPLQLVRRITLGVSLIGLTVIATLHIKNAAYPSIDALDPFGGLETLLKFVAGGEFIKKIEPGTLVLFGGILALGIVLSRFFCGWFCGFGALQAVFGWLGKKIFGRRFTVPRKLDAVLRWIKYPVLLAIVWLTWRAGELVIRPYDPLAAYGHLSTGLAGLWAEFAVGFVLLILSVGLSLLYERAFCKYLCPLGALNAILGRIPLFRIKRVAATCISCAKCDRSCPMNIDISRPEAVNSPECISCMECVTACPTKKNSLVATLGGKAVKLSTVVVLGFLLYAGAAAVGQAVGMLRFSAPSLAEQASAGSLTVGAIKGSSSYGAVADSFGIELERLYRELGLDQAKLPPETMLKDTGKILGIDDFEADAVRLAVAKLTGLPYAGEGGTTGAAAESQEAASPVPPAAGTVPATSPAATRAESMAAPAAAPAKEGASAAETKPAVDRAAPPAPAAATAPSTAPAGTALVVPADFALEGTMSVAEVARALGASTAAVIAKLGLPVDIPVDKTLKELKDQYGYTMPALKERFKQ